MKNKWEKGLKRAVVSALLLSMTCQALPAAVNAADSEISLTSESISAKSSKSHQAGLAVDGSTSTYWQSIPSDGEGDSYARMYDHNRYIDIDLGGTYDLSQIKIYNVVNGTFNNYYVYASSDGVNYDKIISKTSDTLATSEGDTWNVDKSAAYLRLNMAYNSASFATNLAEIEVYGTKTGPTPADASEIQVEDWEGSSWQIEWDKFESDESYAQQKVLTEMSNLVGRVLGDIWKASFKFEIRESQDGSDEFELLDGGNNTIVIRGNNGIAMASGFNYYLKNYVNIDYSPLSESNVALTEIKAVGETVVKKAQFDIRYALNFCTYSYTMAFWNWDEYEEFLDWAAMNGINLILDIVGQEEVLRQMLREFNYTDDEIKDYLCGPAYVAWFYMQNMYSSGGPLPNSWFEQRVELGRKIHDRMQTYGINPVIQGFAGQVPETFAEKNDGAVLTPIDGWSGYTRPSIIKTYLTDEEVAAGKENYFAQAAEVFYEKQKNVFGDVSDYYATDPFHEGGNVGTLDVANIYQTVQQEMLKSNPNAVWVMQQWQGNLDSTKMSLLDTSRTLALDLQADMNPQHGLFEQNGSSWIYCMLHNFGGRMGLDGEIPVIASDPINTYNSTNNMKGIGITAEALENSPVMYELMFDTTWSEGPIDYNAWVEKYAQRRAGGNSDSLQEAWDILLETAYADKGIYYQGAAETVINCRPGDTFYSASTWGHSNILYDKEKLDRALVLLAENYDEFKDSPAYRYDLADVAEQVLCNAAVEYHSLMVQAKNAGDADKFKALSQEFLKLIDLSDQILSITDEFMLGTWIEAARTMIPGADDWTKDLMEFNARSLITTWGGERVGSLKDYSNRKWAGLTSSFYKERWEIWIRNRIAELEGTAKDPDDVRAESNWFMWEYQWVNRKSDDDNGAYGFSTTPSDANLKELAMTAYDDFSYTNLKENVGNITEKKINIAEGKLPVTASATQSGDLKNITDNNTGTEWVASGVGPHTLEIDLEKSYDISEIVLSVPQLAKEFPYTYKVEIYDEETDTWTQSAEYTERKMASNVTIAQKCTGSRLRVTMTTSDTSDSPLTITEIVVYGKEAGLYNCAAGIIPTTNKTNTDAGYPLSNITDENTGNIWKTTDWGSTAYPAYVKVDLGKVLDVEYVELYFESAGRPFIFNVTATDEDGKEFTIYDEYSDASSHPGVLPSASFKIDMTQQKTQRIQAVTVNLTGITGQGEFGVSGPAVSELIVMGKEITADKTQLRTAIQKAKTEVNGGSGDYEAATWEAFQKALNSAENISVASGVTQEQVDSAKDALIKAQAGLVMLEKTELSMKIEEIAAALGKLNKANYPEEKWNTLLKAKEDAENLLESSELTQAEIDAALENLVKAYQELEDSYIVLELPYTDVTEGHWFYDYVCDVYAKGLMTGLNATTFGPDQNLARAQFAVILYRMEGSPAVKYTDKFPDVEDGLWYTSAILWAADKGIVTGYSNTGKFGPSDNITREQMAVMMFRYAKYKGIDTTETKSLSSFPDGDKVQVFAVDGMKWCTAKGIISGKGEEPKSLEPQGNTNRAECATIISRYTNLK